MGKNFNSYSETIKYAKENPMNDELFYYGAQLWERKISWDYLKEEKGIIDYKFTSFSGTDKYDLIYTKDGIKRLVEIKFRYVNSDKYNSSMCEKDKFHYLLEESARMNCIAEYWNIFLDGVIKIYDFRYTVKQEANFARDASDGYNTTNKKNYSMYLLTEHDQYIKKFRDTITNDEINNFAIKELNKRGFEVPEGFKINKK